MKEKVENQQLIKQQNIHVEEIIQQEVKQQQVGEYTEKKESGKIEELQQEFVQEFDEVVKEEGLQILPGEVPKLPEYEGIEKKSVAVQQKDNNPPEVIEPVVLKKEIEIKYDKVQTLPPALSLVMEKIKEWKGKLKEGSSLPIVRAIRDMEADTTDENKAAHLAELVTASLNYLDMRKGYRFTGSGRQRQSDVKELIREIGAYLPEARGIYAQKIKTALKGGTGDGGEIPEKYRSFYSENELFLEKKDLADHLNSVYGEKNRSQKGLSKYEREPHAEVKLSKLSSEEFADQFAAEYKDVVEPEVRKEKQKNKRSRLYKKLQNRKLLEEAEKKEEMKLDNDLTEEKFLILLDDYMKIDLKNIDLSSDAAVVSSASRMEKMVQKHQRIIEGIQIYRSAYEALTPDAKDIIDNQLKTISTLTSYYRVCKIIIKDDLYSSHYDHELSLSADIIDGKESRQRLSMLLQLKMSLEASLAEDMCPKGVDHEKRAQLKDFYAVNFYTENREEGKKLDEKKSDFYGKGFWSFEFNKAYPNETTNYNIHYDTLHEMQEGTKEYEALAGKEKLKVDGVKMGESFFRTMESIGNLRTAAGLGMAKQELTDLISDIMAKDDEARYIRGVKKLRDMCIAHAKYVTNKYRGSFSSMDAKEAKEHNEEILQDLQLMTNLGEAFYFFKRCPTLYENKEMLKEIMDISKDLSAISGNNYGNADMLKLEYYNTDFRGKYYSNGDLLKKKADSLSGFMTGKAISELVEANGVLYELEQKGFRKPIKWEGAHTVEETEKAKELSDMGEMAYSIKKTLAKTLPKDEEFDRDAAMESLEKAVESMPLLHVLTVSDVKDNLETFKLARLQWERLKDDKDISEDKKEAYSEFASKFDALEVYLDAYSNMIRHPGYVKLALQGITLPKDGPLVPAYTSAYLYNLSKAKENQWSPDTLEALKEMEKLVGKWYDLLGTQDEEVNILRDNYYSAKVLADKETQVERSLNAGDHFDEYNNVLSANLEKYGKENKIHMGVNGRKLHILISALSAIDGISLEESRTLYTDLAENVDRLMDKPEILSKKAKAIERLFEFLMKVDFSKIHTDMEHVTENGDISFIWGRFGMELDNFFKEYVKIAESGVLKDLKYDEADRVELKARFGALMMTQRQVDGNLSIMKNPIAKTEEGKQLLAMKYEDLAKWLSKHKKTSELTVFAQSINGIKQDEMLGTAKLTAEEQYKKSFDEEKQKARKAFIEYERAQILKDKEISEKLTQLRQEEDKKVRKKLAAEVLRLASLVILNDKKYGEQNKKDNSSTVNLNDLTDAYKLAAAKELKEGGASIEKIHKALTDWEKQFDELREATKMAHISEYDLKIFLEKEFVEIPELERANLMLLEKATKISERVTHDFNDAEKNEFPELFGMKEYLGVELTSDRGPFKKYTKSKDIEDFRKKVKERMETRKISKGAAEIEIMKEMRG